MKQINPYVVVYLAAIVAANLLVSAFGPAASIYIAFGLIGLDLSLRDKLHDKWNGDLSKLWGIVSAGSLITIAMNLEAIDIAIASASAFGVAFIADGILYHLLRKKIFLVRANGSNVAGAAADSIIFPLMAFGLFPGVHWIILGQFAAKLVGGAVFSIGLNKLKA